MKIKFYLDTFWLFTGGPIPSLGSLPKVSKPITIPRIGDTTSSQPSIQIQPISTQSHSLISGSNPLKRKFEDDDYDNT